MMYHFKWMKNEVTELFLAILPCCGADSHRWIQLFNFCLGKAFLLWYNGTPFWWSQNFLELCFWLSGAMGEGHFSVHETGNTFCDTMCNLLRTRAKMGLCYYPEPEFLCHVIPWKAAGPPASMLGCRTVDSKACQKCAGFVSIPWVQCERSKEGKLQMRAQRSRSSFEDSLCLPKCIVPAAPS